MLGEKAQEGPSSAATVQEGGSSSASIFGEIREPSPVPTIPVKSGFSSAITVQEETGQKERKKKI